MEPSPSSQSPLPRDSPAPTATATSHRLEPVAVDALGELIMRDAKLLKEHRDPVFFLRTRQARGDFTALRAVRSHPAYQTLRTLKRSGAPVLLSTPPWPRGRVTAALSRGPHKSARDHVEFLRDEMADMVQKAFWIVLPYRSVAEWPKLRVSPIGVVPQVGRRPRTIVDYSFYGVNHDTVPLAPAEAMQFGKALERILTQLVHADPRFGPTYLLKLDISDGFYRIWVRAPDLAQLGVAFPQLAGEEPIIAFPLSLPMGWTQSPPFFCAATETIADLANFRLRRWRNPPVHPLEDSAGRLDRETSLPTTTIEPPPAPKPSRPPTRPNPRIASFVDVFVDDFVALAQGTKGRRKRVRRILLQAVDEVLRPTDTEDSPHRKTPISLKKLNQGDGAWATEKEILGWLVDTVALTISLPQRKVDRLATLLASILPTQRRLGLRKWHRLLGELRSMALALPGARGLFSALQRAHSTEHQGRVRLDRGFHDAINDFRWLARSAEQRPTSLFEVVPTYPVVVGAHDASGIGAGGVLLPNHDSLQHRAAPLLAPWNSQPAPRSSPGPVLWRWPFPPRIRRQLISSWNPHGTISNSDLELSAAVLHDAAAAHCFDVRHRTTKAHTDNTATLFWVRKGSATTRGPPAQLLRLKAIQQRAAQHLPLIDYMAAQVLATMDPAEARRFRRDLSAAHRDVAAGVVPSRAAANLRHWSVWTQYCTNMGVDPTLQDCPDPIPLLQVFARRLRTGHLSPSRRQLRSRTVEDTVRAVGQAFASVGAPDPRLDARGQLDFRLRRQLSSYARDDDPPNRVRPLPVILFHHLMHVAHSRPAIVASQATADMIALAFFFLLRPGEYTGQQSGASAPFRLQDVTLYAGRLRLDPLTAPPETLHSATFATLTFSTQKNGVRGETIGLGRSGHRLLCPVLALVRRIQHLRQHHAPPATPLGCFYGPHLQPVTAADITAALRLAVTALGPAVTGVTPDQISARSLRASGATALLCANVDSDHIRLLGRWRSDEMYRYLHVQNAPTMHSFASRMLGALSHR